MIEEDGEQGNELVIRFEYRAAAISDWPTEVRTGKSKPPSQKDLSMLASSRVLAVTEAPFRTWVAELAKPHVANGGAKADYSRLDAHLRRYTARNTFDYFIHKNLGTFLRRELDFYIKNEVMHLDDIESETAPRFEQYLSKIKVIRNIAGKIITFLAQLENFQKKLWLKKKFVVETQYCMTVGCVPDSFYPELLANDGQRAEWVKLLAIDEIKGDVMKSGYTKKLKPDFLKAHPTLVLDTKHFDADFTARLVGTIRDLNNLDDGVLIHSENSQALTLIQSRYREKVECVYIDPPYNTDASAIDYKNGYKASSWMSLLNDRLHLSKALLTTDGVLITAIDDEQQRELSFLLSENFGGRLLGTICVRANPSGRPTQAGYSVSHEYMLFAGGGPEAVIGRMPATEDQAARFAQRDDDGVFEWRNLRREGSTSDRAARPALYYPIYLRGKTLRIPKMEWNDQAREWRVLSERGARRPK